MQLARTVDAQTNQEIVFLEEGTPVVVEQQPIGLEGVLHGLSRKAVRFDEIDSALEEFEFHQCGFAALPGYGYLRRAVRLQQLADVGLEGGIRHAAFLVGIERLLGKKKAVGAVNVAGGSTGFRQKVKARRTAEWQRRKRGISFNKLSHVSPSFFLLPIIFRNETAGGEKGLVCVIFFV